MAETTRGLIKNLKKGKLVMIDDEPCKVVNLATSKPGKHGHLKVQLQAVSLVSGSKKNLLGSGHTEVDIPILKRKEAQVVAIMGNKAQIMDLETYETYELPIPEELKSEIKQGKNVEIEEAPNYKVITKALS